MLSIYNTDMPGPVKIRLNSGDFCLDIVDDDVVVGGNTGRVLAF